jgi:N-acetylmuramoyl-L-alanine amidase-like protein
MLWVMSESTLDRRTFVALVSTVLGAAGALGMTRLAAASGRGRDANVFTGQETFARLLTLAHERAWTERSIGERIGATGMALRQTPYADATLELSEDREVCSINLRGLDCVTFFESALAFARMLRRGGRTPGALLAEVTFTRYRGGRLTDYASRLHYLSDWFADNAEKHVVRLVTRELPGSARFAKRVNFMSQHPEAYRQLKGSRDLVGKIARVEAQINQRETEYVPKAKVADALPLLMTGDIVGITTTIDGLDCAHAGVCYRDEGTLKLLHASTRLKAVILDEDLATYLGRVPTHTGIMVARPLEVA